MLIDNTVHMILKISPGNKMILLKIGAWFGLVLIALGLPLSFSSSSTWINTGQLGSGIGYWLSWLLAVAGVLLIIIGGIITRPRFLWIGAILVGSIYIASFYGWIAKESEPILFLILLPGIVCIVGGGIIQILGKRSRESH
jgi:hypothetical protein